MGEIVNISAEVRDKAGKGIARSVRREGKVPAIIYGNNEDSIATVSYTHLTLPTTPYV